VFAKDPYLWTNFRRGNTLIEIYDPSNYDVVKKMTIGRKGLTKFFDVKIDYVSKEKRYKEELNEFESDVKNLTFAGAKKAILEGSKIEVIKTLKANGENCQISWSEDL
jgi:hypothetical protein